MDQEQASPVERPRRRPYWRRILQSHDFVRDITVTTLGVLIALAIGEVVDEIRWKFRVDATMTAMEDEFRLVHAIYRERLRLQPCVTRRLSEVQELLQTARVERRLPDVQNISFPPFYGEAGDSWTLALGTEIPLHMDRDQVLQIATLWVNEDFYTRSAANETEAWEELRLIEGRAGPVSDDLLTEVEKSLAKAKAAALQAWSIAHRDSETFAQSGITASMDGSTPLTDEQLSSRVRERYFCQPLRVDGRPYQLKGPAFRFQGSRPSSPVPA